MGAIGAPTAAAELEGGDEPGLVTVDTPTGPTNDVQALLHQVCEYTNFSLGTVIIFLFNLQQIIFLSNLYLDSIK